MLLVAIAIARFVYDADGRPTALPPDWTGYLAAGDTESHWAWDHLCHGGRWLSMYASEAGRETLPGLFG